MRDAVYRGTLVCDKLPFSAGKGREAIEVTIAGGTVRYSHVVRLRDAAEPVPEQGKGSLNGQDIELQGSWESGNRQYEAKYSGRPQGDADLDGRRQELHARMHRHDQTAIPGFSAGRKEVRQSGVRAVSIRPSGQGGPAAPRRRARSTVRIRWFSTTSRPPMITLCTAVPSSQ